MVSQNSLTFLRGTRATIGSEMGVSSPSMGTPLFQQTSLRDKGFLRHEKIFLAAKSEFFRNPQLTP
jgi:hypothetical protein